MVTEFDDQNENLHYDSRFDEPTEELPSLEDEFDDDYYDDYEDWNDDDNDYEGETLP